MRCPRVVLANDRRGTALSSGPWNGTDIRGVARGSAVSLTSPPFYASSPGVPPPPRPAPSRMRAPLLLAVFIGLLVGLVVVAGVAIWVRRPGPETPSCPPDKLCGNPPTGSGALVTSTTWRSSLGVQVEYNDSRWSLDASSDTELRLRLGSAGSIWIQVSKGSSPQEMFDGRLDDLRSVSSDLDPDTKPEREILGPSVGYRDGPGGAYAGTVDTAQGPGDPIAVAVMASDEGDVTVVVSVVAAQEIRGAVFFEADSLLNTLRWPSEAR